MICILSSWTFNIVCCAALILLVANDFILDVWKQKAKWYDYLYVQQLPPYINVLVLY